MNTETSQVLDAAYTLALIELVDARAERILAWVKENEHLLPGASDLVEDLNEIIARISMIRTLSEFAFSTPEKTNQLEFAL